jgi:transcriptional regulator with XRE-family HTH domain
MSVISENIRKYRRRRGLRQAELGAMLNRAATVISNWESDIHKPDVISIERMCEIFEVDPNTLFGWDAKSSSSPEFLMMDHFRQLNDTGQEALIATAKGLAGNEEYKKAYSALSTG